MANKKILFFKLGALGDVLMSTPLIRQVRKNYPNAKIDFLIGKSSAIVLKNNKNINKIISFNPNIFLKKNLFGLIRLIKQIKKQKYDLIFILDKHWIFNLTAFLFGIKKRIGFNRRNEGILLTTKVPYGQIRHEIYYYLDLGKKVGLKIDYKDIQIDLTLTKQDDSFARFFWKKYQLNGKKVAMVAPGGGNEADKFSYMRVPSVYQYINLIKELLNKKYYIILVGAKNDSSIGKKIIQKINSKRIINLIEKTSPAQTAALSKFCNCAICNDAGAMHIIASSNKKVYSIFTITNPLKKAPLWKTSKSIWLNKEDYCKKCEIIGNYSYYNKKINKIFKKQIRISEFI